MNDDEQAQREKERTLRGRGYSDGYARREANEKFRDDPHYASGYRRGKEARDRLST